eukprot:5365919-Amphidinium_carterae.1
MMIIVPSSCHHCDIIVIIIVSIRPCPLELQYAWRWPFSTLPTQHSSHSATATQLCNPEMPAKSGTVLRSNLC